LAADMRLSPEDCLAVSAALEKLPREGSGTEAFHSQLRCAYTTLFTHPETPLISPYESQYLFWRKHPDGSFKDAPRMFVCPAAVDAERLYKKTGLSRSKELNEPGDYIATELEFVAHLFSRTAELIGFDENDKLAYDELNWLDEVYAEFSRLHIQKWWLSFFTELAASREHPFYSLIGTIGISLLEALPSSLRVDEKSGS